MKKLIIAGSSLVLALAFISPGLAQNSGSARAQEARESAQERVEAIKEKVAAKRAEVKEGVCEKRKEKLENNLEILSTQAAKLKTVIDTMFIRVQGFYDEGKLTVENYDDLKTAVETASADADAAVSTIESFNLEIDCENTNLGRQLDGFRTAVKETRTALKDYRKALVELISAMNNGTVKEDAANNSADNTDGGEE